MGSSVGAYFDLDGTIITCSSEGELAKRIYNSKSFLKKPLFLSRWLLSSSFRLLTGHSFYDAVRNRQYLAGTPWDLITKLSDEIAESHLAQHISGDALKQIEWHKSQGHRLVMVTATLWPLAKPIAEKLGFDEFYASDVPLTTDKIVIGTEKGKQIPRRKGKIEVVLGDAEKNEIDMSNSWGYGNSKADTYFMKLCGNPIAINPTKPMEKFSKKNNWDIKYWKVD